MANIEARIQESIKNIKEQRERADCREAEIKQATEDAINQRVAMYLGWLDIADEVSEGIIVVNGPFIENDEEGDAISFELKVARAIAGYAPCVVSCWIEERGWFDAEEERYLFCELGCEQNAAICIGTKTFCYTKAEDAANAFVKHIAQKFIEIEAEVPF